MHPRTVQQRQPAVRAPPLKAPPGKRDPTSEMPWAKRQQFRDPAERTASRLHCSRVGHDRQEPDSYQSEQPEDTGKDPGVGHVVVHCQIPDDGHGHEDWNGKETHHFCFLIAQL
jgi:hypothetical protein